MTRTSGSGSRVSIPQGREELPSIITEGAIVPLRRHERNLRSRSFRSPLDVVYREPWEASRCMAIRNSTQRAFKKDSCWPLRLSDAARSQYPPSIRVILTGGWPVLICPGFRVVHNLQTFTARGTSWRRRYTKPLKLSQPPIGDQDSGEPETVAGKSSLIDHSSGAGPLASVSLMVGVTSRPSVLSGSCWVLEAWKKSAFCQYALVLTPFTICRER